MGFGGPRSNQFAGSAKGPSNFSTSGLGKRCRNNVAWLSGPSAKRPKQCSQAASKAGNLPKAEERDLADRKEATWIRVQPKGDLEKPLGLPKSRWFFLWLLTLKILQI